MTELVREEMQPGMRAKVLLVSDEPSTARIWCNILNEVSIDTTLLSSPEEALQIWSEAVPDLIVIDAYARRV